MDASIDRETERSNLDEIIRAAESEHGPITSGQIDACRARLRAAHARLAAASER